MTNDNEKEKEIEEIKRRIDYLISTDKISVSEKIAIANKALKVIQESGAKKTVQ